MHTPTPSARAWAATALAIVLFAGGFAIANRFQLTHGVLYRLAASDLSSAAGNFLVLAVQAAAWLAAIAFLGRALFLAALALASASILVNLGYGQTLNDVIDAGKLAWLLVEARQAGNAAGEFARPLLLAALQTLLAVALFVGARWFLRRGRPFGSGRVAASAGLAALLAPSLLAVPLGVPASAAERNVYSLGYDVATAEPAPPRAAVALEPDVRGAPRHIVWLVDESVAHRQFREILAPRLAGFSYVDFGMAASLGHCSAPSNLALRSGVDVRHANAGLDLRRTPSIWGYARKAGYRTVLIDGQARGAPQNLLLPPERALIDNVVPAAGSRDTDRAIATRLNRQLRGPGRTFTYAVLRGVHFQYRDHYPAGMVPAGSSTLRQYEAAVEYSKRGFFDRLLERVNREDVAIVYTSDHGQNLAPGAVPHCSPSPVPAELLVPLIAFLPERLAARYALAPRVGHSASQIFTATLIWMGYGAGQVERRYDNDLARASARYVRFDRNVVPLRTGDPIGIAVSATFPGEAFE